MKNQWIIATLIIFLCFSGIQTATAQLSLGGSLTYGSEIESLGLNINGIYVINEQFRAGGDVSYYFPKDYGSFKSTWWELNANGHYLFTAEEDLNFYGLAGLNYSVVTVTFDDSEFGSGGSASEGDIGLNLGGGAEYGLGKATSFSELKYVLGNDQLAVTAGVRVPIK